MNHEEKVADLSLRLLGRAYDQLDRGERRVIRAIAERHGARLALDASERLGGLKVTVEFAPR